MQMQTQQRAQHAASSTAELNLYKTSLLALALRLLFCQLLLWDVLFVSQPQKKSETGDARSPTKKKHRKLVVPAVLAKKNRIKKGPLVGPVVSACSNPGIKMPPVYRF
jgi:hypothetical protein